MKGTHVMKPRKNPCDIHKIVNLTMHPRSVEAARFYAAKSGLSLSAYVSLLILRDADLQDRQRTPTGEAVQSHV